MGNIDLFKSIYEDINFCKYIDIKKIGSIREIISDNIHIYDPKDSILSTIIVYNSSGEIKKVSFAGRDFKLFLNEIELFLGKYRYAYNFRDNYTQFFFESIPNSNSIIKSVSCKKENNIEFSNDDFGFLEKDPKGNVKKHNENELTFDNFIIELK